MIDIVAVGNKYVADDDDDDDDALCQPYLWQYYYDYYRDWSV